MEKSKKNITEVKTSDQSVLHISKAQLPLHCPLPETSLWNQHPKVYIAVENSEKEKCPYCGTEYILEEN